MPLEEVVKLNVLIMLLIGAFPSPTDMLAVIKPAVWKNTEREDVAYPQIVALRLLIFPK